MPCCEDYENRECIATTPDTTLVNGKCVCSKKDYMVNEDGQCIECEVDNCKRCEPADVCVECEGEMVLKDGECVCEEGFPGPNSTCTSCKVPGCLKCSNPNTCI